MLNTKYPDIGYTPENLRHFINTNNMTRRRFVEHLNSLGYNYSIHTVHKWLLPLDSPHHTDMPIRVWDTLLKGGF